MGNCLIRRRKSVISEKEYLGQLIPRTQSNANLSASSNETGRQPYYAFDGVLSPDLRYADSAWTAGQNDSNPWIRYSFGSLKRYFDKIKLIVFSNYADDWVGNIIIQGSNDGSNWDNLLVNSNEIEITAKYQELTTIEIPLQSENYYSFIRVLGTSAFNVYYNPSLWIDDVYVYGGRKRGTQ